MKSQDVTPASQSHISHDCSPLPWEISCKHEIAPLLLRMTKPNWNRSFSSVQIFHTHTHLLIRCPKIHFIILPLVAIGFKQLSNLFRILPCIFSKCLACFSIFKLSFSSLCKSASLCLALFFKKWWPSHHFITVYGTFRRQHKMWTCRSMTWPTGPPPNMNYRKVGLICSNRPSKNYEKKGRITPGNFEPLRGRPNYGTKRRQATPV